MKTSVSHKSSRDFTKSCIMEALLQLMHSKDYNDISITDITSRAGVSRMAYYRNYRSKDHILMDYMCQIIKEYAAELDGSKFFSDFQTYDHILWGLKYLQKYKDYVLCLKKANRAEIVLYGLDLYMLHVTKSLEKSSLEKYELYYYSGALYNIFMHWIEDNMQEDITVIASIIYGHVQHHRFHDLQTQMENDKKSACNFDKL